MLNNWHAHDVSKDSISPSCSRGHWYGAKWQDFQTTKRKTAYSASTKSSSVLERLYSWQAHGCGIPLRYLQKPFPRKHKSLEDWTLQQHSARSTWLHPTSSQRSRNNYGPCGYRKNTISCGCPLAVTVQSGIFENITRVDPSIEEMIGLPRLHIIPVMFNTFHEPPKRPYGANNKRYILHHMNLIT